METAPCRRLGKSDTERPVAGLKAGKKSAEKAALGCSGAALPEVFLVSEVKNVALMVEGEDRRMFQGRSRWKSGIVSLRGGSRILFLNPRRPVSGRQREFTKVNGNGESGGGKWTSLLFMTIQWATEFRRARAYQDTTK